jgi:hypothetical protein
MKTSAAIAALLFLTHGSWAQTKPSRKQPTSASAAADRVGLTCARILEMSSTDWVAQFNKEKDPSPEGTARAIATYGKCYDTRADALAATVAKRGAAPSKNARADFLGFESALKEFISKAVADAQPAPDTTKIAYINLYEKQFRYEFYRAYAEKNLNPPLAPIEEDQFGKAKNRFGELLGLLPEDKAHEVHEAFGEIVGTHEISLPMKLALYRFAIFVLEPSSETPFSPPPF